MKKYLIIFILTIAVLLFTSCSYKTVGNTKPASAVWLTSSNMELASGNSRADSVNPVSAILGSSSASGNASSCAASIAAKMISSQKSSMSANLGSAAGAINAQSEKPVFSEPVSGANNMNNLTTSVKAWTSGGYVYYLKYLDPGEGLYRMKADGTGKKLIIPGIDSYRISPDGYICYLTNNKYHTTATIHRISSDLKETQKTVNYAFDGICPLSGAGKFYLLDGSSLYYYDFNTNAYSLFRINAGQIIQKSFDDQDYAAISTSLGQMGFDYKLVYGEGSDCKVVSQIEFYGNQLYFMASRPSALYRYQAGYADHPADPSADVYSNSKFLFFLNSYAFVISNDGWIYYDNNDDGRCLYKMKLDGTGKKKLSNKLAYSISTIGNWVFYMSTDKSVHMIKSDASVEYTL